MGALLKGATGVQRIKSDGLTRDGELWEIDWALQASHGVWQLMEMIGPSECRKSWQGMEAVAMCPLQLEMQLVERLSQ